LKSSTSSGGKLFWGRFLPLEATQASPPEGKKKKKGHPKFQRRPPLLLRRKEENLGRLIEEIRKVIRHWGEIMNLLVNKGKGDSWVT